MWPRKDRNENFLYYSWKLSEIEIADEVKKRLLEVTKYKNCPSLIKNLHKTKKLLYQCIFLLVHGKNI